MAKSREKMMAELADKKISFTLDMTDKQLADLLKAPKTESTEGDKETPPSEKPVSFKKVANGVATANDHEKRITILEAQVAAIQKLIDESNKE